MYQSCRSKTGVERGQDLGGELLLELLELGLAELALELGRDEDEVDDLPRRRLREEPWVPEVPEVDDDRPAAGDEDNRCDLPPVLVPPALAASAGEVDDLRAARVGEVVPGRRCLRRRRSTCGGGLVAEEPPSAGRADDPRETSGGVVVPRGRHPRARSKRRRRLACRVVAEEPGEGGARVLEVVHAVLIFG